MLPVANAIKGSSTDSVCVLTVVDVPLTVRLPEIVKSFPIVTSFGKPIVISLPETDVSISFAVPENVKVSPPATVSLVPESAAISKDVAMAAVDAAVIRPLASTVKTGTAVVEP